MAYTTALYYPWIEIRDESWLRTGLLYWDTIRTIVPQSMDVPYREPYSRFLEDEGVLEPFYVASDLDVVAELEGDFVKYLESNEAKALLYSQGGRIPAYIHPEKLPHSVKRLARIHPDKLPYMIRDLLEIEDVERHGVRGWYRMSEPLADYYMTLLATRIVERIGASLTTEQAGADSLSLVMKTDNNLPDLSTMYRNARRWRLRRAPPYPAPLRFAEGALANLAIEGLSLKPDIPLKDLLNFRKVHGAELGRFRSAIGKLAGSVDGDVALDAMRQQIWDLYKNELEPAVEELKAALNGSRISWFANSLMKTTFLSAGPTSLLATIGLSIPQALLVGAGVSLVVTGILYNVERRNSIKGSPYSYLLNVQSAFGR